MQSCCFANKGWIHLQHTREARRICLQEFKAPSTRIRVFLAFCPHENGLFGHQKHRSPESGPQSGLLKTSTFRLRVDGQKQRFFNTTMSFRICQQHYVCSVRDATVFQSFQCFYVDGRKKNSNTLRVDRVLLLITLRTMKKIQRANATAYGSQMNLPKQK